MEMPIRQSMDPTRVDINDHIPASWPVPSDLFMAGSRFWAL